MARARTPPPPPPLGLPRGSAPGAGLAMGWEGAGSSHRERVAEAEGGEGGTQARDLGPQQGWGPQSLRRGASAVSEAAAAPLATLPASFLPAPLVNSGDQLDRKAQVTPHCLGLTLGFQGFRGTGPLPLALQTSGPGPGSHTAPPRRGTSSLWDICWPQTPLCLSFLLCPRHEWEGRPWGELACPPGLTPTPGPLAERGEAGEEGNPAPAHTPSASCLLLPVIDAAFFVCFRNQR